MSIWWHYLNTVVQTLRAEGHSLSPLSDERSKVQRGNDLPMETQAAPGRGDTGSNITPIQSCGTLGAKCTCPASTDTDGQFLWQSLASHAWFRPKVRHNLGGRWLILLKCIVATKRQEWTWLVCQCVQEKGPWTAMSMKADNECTLTSPNKRYYIHTNVIKLQSKCQE